MKRLKSLILITIFMASVGCSLPPERPVTENELLPLYKAFEFLESPEEILAVLNKEGEVTIPAKFRGRPFYVKILATSRGLVIEYFPRTEAPKEK